MSERKADLIVGIVVVFGLLILVLAVIWGKDVRFNRQMRELAVRFEDVQGLSRGDPVVIRGIRKGYVEEVRLFSEYAQVRLAVHSSVVLHSDLSVTVERQELMGGRQVAIDPGSGEELWDGKSEIRGGASGGLNQIMARVTHLITRADAVLGSINAVLENEPWVSALNNLEKTSDEARAMVRENRNGVRRVVDHLESMTESLGRDSLNFRLVNILSRMDTTLRSLERISASVEDGEGTLGKVLNDPALYSRMTNTLARMDSLLADIKANPKRYVNVSLF
jgi:phospholipid/cholesterol/gamma-HCH transport system substrate-binding protein